MLAQFSRAKGNRSSQPADGGGEWTDSGRKLCDCCQPRHSEIFLYFTQTIGAALEAPTAFNRSVNHDRQTPDTIATSSRSAAQCSRHHLCSVSRRRMFNVDDAELSLEQHAAREDESAGQVLSTAKLVTTFSAAVAATFVATALQVGKPSGLDCAAAWTMLVVLVLTFGVVTVPKATLRPNDLPGGTDRQPTDISITHQNFITNVHKNMRRARWVHWAMIAQVLLSLSASVIAAIEVLRWLSDHPPG